MSQFKGNKHRVRCADCTKLAGGRCMAKDDRVSPKKKRICHLYDFKGEYENRTPAEARYVPHVDKKTKRMLKKLLELGIVPVSEGGEITTQDGYERVKTLPMPRSTATAEVVEKKEHHDRLVQPVEFPSIDAPETSKDRLIWVPGEEND